MIRPSAPLAADLAEATEQFAHWRRTRSHGSVPTPAALRERAVALLGAHRPSTVARVLGINTVMLERWSASLEREATGTPPRFVALPDIPSESTALAPPDSAPAIDSPELVLRWPGGGELLARGAIPNATLRAILETFAPHAPDAAARAAQP